MTDDRELPVSIEKSELPQGMVRDLSLALSLVLNVYGGTGTHRYKVNSRHLEYNVDTDRKYEFSHLLYEISQTEVGKAAIADMRAGDQEFKEKLEESLKFGEDKILYEKSVSGNNDLAVTCIAHALKDISEIKDKLIITQGHFDAIVSVLGKTENGQAGIKEAKEYLGVKIDLPGENISGAKSLGWPRGR